jgi:hypothetical protein
MLQVQDVSPGFRPAGPHLLRVEQPDILFLRLFGPVEQEHFRIFHQAMSEIPASLRIYLLRDARNGGFVTPDARAYISRHSVIDRIEAVVSFGASFQTRTVMTMMNRAMRTFHSREPEIAFFDDESSARVWIDDHRKVCSQQTTRFVT